MVLRCPGRTANTARLDRRDIGPATLDNTQVTARQYSSPLPLQYHPVSISSSSRSSNQDQDFQHRRQCLRSHRPLRSLDGLTSTAQVIAQERHLVRPLISTIDQPHSLAWI